MADNNFKGGPGGRLKAAAANFIKPTTQDSLDLYNQAKVINKFYGSRPDYKKVQETPFDDYLKSNKTSYKELLSKPDDINKGLNALIDPYQIQLLNSRFGTKKTEQELRNKFKNKGVFKTFPNILGAEYDRWINPDVPPIYLHPSIKPQSVSKYEAHYNTFSDFADVPKYDPIAIKPVSMLTPKERQLREKKYGAIPPAPVIERRVSEEVEPLALRQSPAPTFTPGEMIAPVMRPVSVPQTTPMKEPMMEEEVVTERPVGRKLPKAVMPRRQGGWGNQSLLMQLFPKLYER